jgi:phosphoadenosine phosphosulfate reductase
VHEVAVRLRHEHPEIILRWAIETFPRRVALSVSFGGAGVVLAHMLSRIDRSVPLLFLDTGFLFPETYALRDRFAEEYGLMIHTLTPSEDPGPLYKTDPDGCCDIRKVQPMNRALRSYDAWISALRRDQGPSRADTEVVESHEIDGRAVTKVHPLARWNRAEVWQYILENKVPYHPLLDQGYSSLGCSACTRPTQPGESERAGRWSGSEKTECGLHTSSRRPAHQT